MERADSTGRRGVGLIIARGIRGSAIRRVTRESQDLSLRERTSLSFTLLSSALSYSPLDLAKVLSESRIYRKNIQRERERERRSVYER